MESQESLLKELSNHVVDMAEEEAVETAKRYIDGGFDAYEGIDQGLAVGMERAGQLYEEEEYYIPELLMCSDAMYAGMDILTPHLKADESKDRHKVVMGVVEGDTHDIGKNLVKIMLETAGFEVVDLGRDVPPEDFVSKAMEIGAEIIGLSTLMTTTMENMERVVQLLAEKGQSQIRVMVGGGPISSGFARKIGAHYSRNASRAVELAKSLVGEVIPC
ncbi:corrinoid protein [Desulfoluna sp.]|uniref:corrinoid protein n=1 Tax=Desulfoluna sp. TaxID=2045199 RepID=UPI0026207DC2|nr:corrinoid protein [Desulfoluna sp.]